MGNLKRAANGAANTMNVCNVFRERYSLYDVQHPDRMSPTHAFLGTNIFGATAGNGPDYFGGW